MDQTWHFLYIYSLIYKEFYEIDATFLTHTLSYMRKCRKRLVNFIYMISYMKNRPKNDLIFIHVCVCENCHFWTIAHFYEWSFIYERMYASCHSFMYEVSYMKSAVLLSSCFHIWAFTHKTPTATWPCHCNSSCADSRTCLKRGSLIK